MAIEVSEPFEGDAGIAAIVLGFVNDAEGPRTKLPEDGEAGAIE